MMIDSAAGVSSAAPAPWAPRETMSAAADEAVALTSDAIVNSRQTGQEHGAPVEQVGEAAAEEQQSAAEKDVGTDRPLVVAAGEVEGLADAGQRDVHHADVEDDDELGHEHHAENGPGSAGLLSVLFVRGLYRAGCV